jgi:hypothetical protein
VRITPRVAKRPEALAVPEARGWRKRRPEIVSASCELGPEGHHNSAVLASDHSLVTISANCNTSVYGTEWVGF